MIENGGGASYGVQALLSNRKERFGFCCLSQEMMIKTPFLISSPGFDPEIQNAIPI